MTQQELLKWMWTGEQIQKNNTHKQKHALLGYWRASAKDLTSFAGQGVQDDIKTITEPSQPLTESALD